MATNTTIVTVSAIEEDIPAMKVKVIATGVALLFVYAVDIL